MDRKTAAQEIKSRWRDLYPADGRGRGSGIVCPLCGSGSGDNGTGITCDKGSRNYFLKCWNGGCAFNEGGSVIDLYMLEHGMQDGEFNRAVDELARQLRITIDPYTGRRNTTPAEDFDGRFDWNDSINEPEYSYGRRQSSLSGESASTESAQTSRAEQPGEEAREEVQAQEALEAPEKPNNFFPYYDKCSLALAESKEAQAYLRRRGISLETAQKMLVGYDAEWISPTVVKNLQAAGRSWRPEPKPCMILPSTLEHYVARDIRPAEQLDGKQRKYQKMNEGKPGLFGGVRALNSGADAIFVVEGPFDALSIIEVGQQAIALNSTSNVDLLLKKLEAEPSPATFVICLDADEAGRKTAEKLKEGLRRLNISCCDADICCGMKDPNEALTADRAAFERAVARAVASTAARPDSVAAYLDGTMENEIEEFKEAQNRLTGFQNLDEKAGGLNTGLYVLAAISSLGKTTLALQMADQLAAAGHDVIFFSMEQSRLEMVSKSIARTTAQREMRTAVNSLSIRRGCLPPQVLDAVDRYRATVADRLSIVEGNFNCDIAYIRDYITNYIRRNKARPIVFVDYLQILQPAADGKARNSKKDEIDLAITELKRLSRSERITIIVVSSVNRANYQTPIAFESLKESGGIEFTADAATFHL